MTGVQGLQSRPVSSKAAMHGAWERFVRGSDDVHGVRPEVAISWQRCRDQYSVDPYLAAAPAAVTHTDHTLEQDGIFAELGFRSAAIAHEVANAGGVVIIADANGRILAQWGDKATRALAAEAGLAPTFCWLESAVGTNGMGTALGSHSSVSVIREEEHWCQAFHDWTCAGATVRDVVSKEPIAVLNISCWRADLPRNAAAWLSNAVTGAQSQLRHRARSNGAELLAAFNASRGPSGRPLVAVDTAGKVVIADDRSAVLLGVPGNAPALDPAVRWLPQLPSLIHAAAYATQLAMHNPDWVGSTQIFTHLADDPSTVGIHPVFHGACLIGHLISFGAADGVPMSPDHPGRPAIGPAVGTQRIIGHRANRMVLLPTSEVMMAESDGDGVWLATDEGRLRAASSSLDKLAEELGTAEFLRVHRRYVVNPRRVREVERGDKAELTLIMDDRDHTSVPVSRRSARAVRLALGI